MSRHTFTNAERYAIWTVHGERCWICGGLVPYSAVEIDHIIPETMNGKEELKDVLRQFGLPENFNLNSWANWMPADRRCNGAKRERVFKPSPLIQLNIEKAAERASRAAELNENFTKDRFLSIAVERILSAAEDGKLSESHIKTLEKVAYKVHEANRIEERKGKPFEIGPGMTIVADDGSRYMIRGRTGMVGVRPKGESLHPSWDCPFCGPTSWNGIRCTNCGHMIDPD